MPHTQLLAELSGEQGERLFPKAMATGPCPSLSPCCCWHAALARGRARRERRLSHSRAGAHARLSPPLTPTPLLSVEVLTLHVGAGREKLSAREEGRDRGPAVSPGLLLLSRTRRVPTGPDPHILLQSDGC